MSGYQLAIDFGTDFTMAAVRAPGGPIERVRFDGDDRTPSGVLLGRDGALCAGPAVVEEAEFSPSAVEWTPKRLLGQGPAVLGGRLLQDTELVGAVLSYVAREARRMFDDRDPDLVVLTHPAVWTSSRLRHLADAADAAGLRAIQFVEEPVAAACSLATRGRLDAVPVGGLIALYDLGGGTFDTALLERTGASTFATVGPPGGDDHLGGEELDDVLVDYITRTWLSAEQTSRLRDPGGSPDPDAWHRARFELRLHVRRGKERLATAPTARIRLHPLLDREYVQLSRVELDRLAQPLVDRSAEILSETVGVSGRRIDELAAICLAGGSSRLPLVKRTLGTRFGRPITTHGDPKALTAEGALEAAAPARPGAERNDDGDFRVAVRAALLDTRAGTLRLPAALTVDLERMANGPTVEQRLGATSPAPEDLREALLAGNRRWGAFHAVAPPREAAVAEVMRRAYTRTFADLQDIHAHS